MEYIQITPGSCNVISVTAIPSVKCNLKFPSSPQTKLNFYKLKIYTESAIFFFFLPDQDLAAIKPFLEGISRVKLLANVFSFNLLSVEGHPYSKACVRQWTSNSDPNQRSHSRVRERY